MPTDDLHPSARHLRFTVEPAAIDRVERGIVAKRRRRGRRRFYGSIAATFGVWALFIAALGVGPNRGPDVATAKAVILEDGRSLPAGARVPSSVQAKLRLKEGFTMALDKGTDLRVERIESDLVTWTMNVGNAEFSHTREGARQHRVRSPHASITLLASRSKISVAANQTIVFSYRGRVLVEPNGQTAPLVLVAGESVRLPTLASSGQGSTSPERSMEVPGVEVNGGGTADSSPLTSVPRSGTRKRPSRSSRRRSPTPNAADARGEDGPSSTEDIGAVSTEGESNTASFSLAAADQAMREGRFQDAASLLEALLRSQPDGDEAPFAALSLGNVLFDHLDRPEAARAAYERALASPNLPAALRAIAQRRIKGLPRAPVRRPR